jgi:hypothetical protein
MGRPPQRRVWRVRKSPGGWQRLWLRSAGTATGTRCTCLDPGRPLQHPRLCMTTSQAGAGPRVAGFVWALGWRHPGLPKTQLQAARKTLRARLMPRGPSARQAACVAPPAPRPEARKGRFVCVNAAARRAVRPRPPQRHAPAGQARGRKEARSSTARRNTCCTHRCGAAALAQLCRGALGVRPTLSGCTFAAFPAACLARPKGSPTPLDRP